MSNSTTAEIEILQVLNSWLAAARANDVAGIVAHYAPDIIAYDAMKELQFKGVEAYAKHWRYCLDSNPGGMQPIYEVIEPHIVVSDDVAFCHTLMRCGGRMDNGEENTCGFRATIGYRKFNGQWCVVHEHFSAPIDMQTMKMLQLQP